MIIIRRFSRRGHFETLIFAASAGGHLDLLRALAPSVTREDHVVWVTSQTARGAALRKSGADVELVNEYGRSLAKAVRNVVEAARIVRVRRPRVVVTSGAGVVVPFCLLARLAGAQIIYIETMARVSGPSRTARLLSRLARRVIVQWPELAHELPHATVCRPTLLEGLGQDAAGEGARRGTFVAVGTHAQPHMRLLAMVSKAVGEGLLPGPVRVQTGAAEWSADGVTVQRYLGREEVEETLRSAEVVICHGGAGIISSALMHGRTPIVVPRRAELGEHIDDHQFEITRKLADWGLVVPVEDRITAADVAGALHPPRAPGELERQPMAADLLRSELAADDNRNPHRQLVERVRTSRGSDR